MDPHSFIARAEAQRWIGIAEKLLMSHDLVGSKTFAIRARESDPRLEAAEQILAITETLIAAEKPVVGNNGSQQPDYYAILQLVRFVSDAEHIAGQYRRLAILLNPNQNRYPYSEQAFQVVNDAWAVLSNPMRKSVYDSELNYMPHQQQQVSNLGFNIDQQHQHQQPHQQQHNFFEQNQQQQQHLQQHNFLGQQVQPFQQNTQQAQARLQSPPPSAAPQNASYSWPPQSHHQMQEDLKPQVHQHQQLPLHLKSQPHHMKQEHMQHQVPLQQQLQQKQKEQQLQLEQQKKRQQEEEQRRLQEQQLKFQQEEERRRLQEQQKLQQEQEQEQRRLQEQQRLQEQKRRLQEQEEEQRRQQELQQRRLKEQEEEQRRQQEQQRRLKEQEEEQRRQQELQQRRLKEQEEEQRRQQEHQRRLKEQEEEQMRHQQQQQRRLQEQEDEQRRLKEKEEEQRRLQEQEEEQMCHQQQQQEALRQNATPVQLPSPVNTNNGVTEEEMETEPELVAEEETDTADESMDDSPTFWTACPYCFYMYEYPKRYVECTLRCDNCRRAFQAVPVPSPPPTIEGQDAYFYCWGFFPVGVSMSDLDKNNSSKGTKSKWTPFSPLYDASQNHLNECAAPKENTFVNKSSGPRVSFNDMLNEVSELSDDSDIEWDKTQKKKLKRMSNDMISDFKARVQVLALRAKDTINGNDKNKKNSIKGRVGVSTVPVAETSKKFVGSISRKLSGGVAKESGKLDLNVEFDNHVAAGTRGHEDGEEEEDNIEGIGFFEGLDEFLNNLPILSANEEKVKAT